MNMSEKCCGRIWDSFGFGAFAPCSNTGKVERDGKWWCGIHDPVKVAEKRAAKSVAYEKKIAEQSKRWSMQGAAPEMLSTLEWLDSLGGLGSDAHARIRAAIKKAKGEK